MVESEEDGVLDVEEEADAGVDVEVIELDDEAGADAI